MTKNDSDELWKSLSDVDEAMKKFNERLEAPPTLSLKEPGFEVVEGPKGVCPTQAFGTIDGKCWYFRARHGTWSICVGPADQKMPHYVSLTEWAIEGNDSSCGWMTKDEALWCIGIALGRYREDMALSKRDGYSKAVLWALNQGAEKFTTQEFADGLDLKSISHASKLLMRLRDSGLVIDVGYRISPITKRASNVYESAIAWRRNLGAGLS